MLKVDLQNFGSLFGFELMPFGQCFEIPLLLKDGKYIERERDKLRLSFIKIY